MGEDLDLVFGGAGAVAATGAFGGVVLRGGAGEFCCFDGGEELAAVEGSSVDPAVTSSTQEGVGGEAVGSGGDVGVVEVSDWCCGEGLVFLEVGIAGGDCGLGIAREVTHENGF